jgi:8-oxo-dGTP pyrophosphatase MutT (NUDIX family)
MYVELDGPEPPRRRTGVAGFFTRHIDNELTILLRPARPVHASHGRDQDRGRHLATWQLPGGDTLYDEFLHEAYVREITEKVGLPAASPEEILVVDHIPSGVTEPEGIDVVFKGGEIPRGTAVAAATAFRWATLGETDRLCPANERDRIRSAHEAWTTGRTAYLICGERFSARPF